MRRKEFCAAHGLSVPTLDAWRRRCARPGSREAIVPVEIVDNRATRTASMGAANIAPSAPFRVVLAQGLRVEVEPGFDADELRRLIAALDPAELGDGPRRSV